MSKQFQASDVWDKLGITEHLGGTNATRRLIDFCGITSNQRVLDVGCGTGYSACWLAKQLGARVVAVDISSPVLERARERIDRQGLSDKVTLVQGDIHALDFPAESFDAVIAESILIFCRKPQAVGELYRVLKHGGVLGSNEFTYLQLPPPEWKRLLSSDYFGLDIQPLLGAAWVMTFGQAGFLNEVTEIHGLRLSEQFSSHIRVDGWRRYIAAVLRGLADVGVWKSFLNPPMLRAWRQFPAYVGYGLYVNRKP